MKIRNTLMLAMTITMVTGCGIDGRYFGGLINISGTNSPETHCLKCTDISDTTTFNWEEMIPVYMHYYEGFDFEEHFPRYLAIFYPDVWKRVKDDEFAFQHSKEKYLPSMKKVASKVDPETVYLANTRILFGEYNMEGEYFPIVKGDLSKVTLITHSTIANNRTQLDTLPYPRKFQVKLTGTKGLLTDRLSINKVDAEQMLLRRKNQYGTVDRTVIAKTYFKIERFEDDQFIARVIDVRYEI